MSDNSKMCRKCKEVKSFPNFSKSGKKYPDGLAGWCKPCMKVYAADYYRRNSQKMRIKARKSQLRLYFNLSVEDYENMYRAQNGACAVCRGQSTDGRRLAVDHCHSTGKVRGLLCYRCNIGIGYLKDSPERLRDAAAYLEGQITVTR